MPSKFRVSVTLNTKVRVVNNLFGLKSLDALNRQFGVAKVAPLIKAAVLSSDASVLERNLFFTYKLEGETILDLADMQHSYMSDSHVVRFNRPLKKVYYGAH